MKIIIDTETKIINIQENINLQHFFEWCVENLSNWREFTMVNPVLIETTNNQIQHKVEIKPASDIQ